MNVVSTFNVPLRIKGYEEKKNNGSQNGAMLSMLAEVATQTLRADNRAGSASPSPPVAAKRKRSREVNGMPLNQARMLSGNQLVRTFSRFEGDELRRVFSFQCLLIPKRCHVAFESFGSETKARNRIKDHLLAHLDKLPEGEVLQVPRQQEEIPYKKSTATVNKTNKKLKTLKPVDSKHLEISEVPNEYFSGVIIKQEPNTVGTMCLPLEESYEELQVAAPVSDGSHTPDHDYFRTLDTHTATAVVAEHEEYTDVQTIWIKAEPKDDINSGITNYVLEDINSSEDHDMLSVSNEVVVKTEVSIDGTDLTTYFREESFTIKSDDLPVLQDNRVLEGEMFYEESCIERDEHRQHKKPKGKAKFIGQSAAEKEMAVRMIETMKLKQGSGEPLECQICVPPRVFTAPTTLISHYRSHAGIKPYECHLCGGVFTRQHSLNYHLLIHSNKTRFTCTDCGRKFRHPSHFKEHQRRHTGEAPFECSDCVIRFKTRNTYKRHLKTRHGKVLTQSGGIIILSEEEFRRVRTAPRSLQTRVSSDKENNRRPRPKAINFVRRSKQKKAEGGDEVGEFIQKYSLSGNWSTNLIEPEVQLDTSAAAEESQTVTILQGVPGTVGPTTVMLLSMDNTIYKNMTVN